MIWPTGGKTYKFDKDGNVYIDSMRDNGDEYCPGYGYRISCELTGKERTDTPSRGGFPSYSRSSSIDRDFFVPKSKLAKHHGIPLINAKGNRKQGIENRESSNL